MPTVALVDGVKVQFYWDDHPPAHFHVEWGEYRAQIAIATLKIIRGYLPKAKYRRVVTWAEPRKDRLLDAWSKCQSDLHPGRLG